MIPFAHRVSARVLSVVLVLGTSWPAWADPARIAHSLHVPDLLSLMQKEGEAYGADLYETMLNEPADTGWTGTVTAIHNPKTMMPIFRKNFDAALDGTDQSAIEAWLTSREGQRIIRREIQVRRALLDSDRESKADAHLAEARAANDPRLALVRQVIDSADLIEANVIGGMNSNLAFYRAMAAGGAFPDNVTDAEMTDDVTAQEPDIRDQVTDWLEAYLFEAYATIPADDLNKLIAFNRSAPGQALLRAEFGAFGVILETTSADVGTALAKRLTASAL